MKKITAVAIFVMVLVAGFFLKPALGASSEPVSPGIKGYYAVIGQDCPTFSWSAAADALTYRLEVYELVTDYAMSREQIRQTALPVVAKEIPAPAFAWTAPLGECLARGGSYIWYVQGLDSQGEGGWSEGSVFGIEAQALTVEQKEAVQELVKEYFEADLTNLGGTTAVADNATADASRSALIAGSKAASSISPMSLEGTYNTLLGTNAGAALTAPATGSQYATFIGLNAGANTTSGQGNTFIGSGAGYSNTTGGFNSSFGMNAGYSNQVGTNNSSFGIRAGYNNTVGAHVFFGADAGYSHSGNSSSISDYFGYRAGYSNAGNSYNNFFGSSSGSNNTGDSSSIFGAQAGLSSYRGNSFFGASAGYNNGGGEKNVFLGYKAGYNEAGSNRLYIANSDTSSPLIYGEFDNGVVKINGRLVMASDERLKENIEPLESALDKVMRLEGVSYQLKSAKSGARGFGSDREIGLLAQNVEAVLPELVHTDGQGYKAVAYDKMAAVLIEAIKEQQIEMEQDDAYFEALLKREASSGDSLNSKEAILASGALPEPVSPGVKGGHAVIGQDCPTFSWSAAADAVAYRVEVYEMDAVDVMSRGQMRQTALPVVEKEIPGPAFTWTAPLGECLARGGSYIWYVQGLDARGEGGWSEGRVFGIESQALTARQKHAVQELVKEYLEADHTNSTESKTVSAISVPMTLTEGTTNTLLGTNAGAGLTDPGTNDQNLTFIGANAGRENTSGGLNTFVGNGAGYHSATYSNNCFLGNHAGWYNQGSYNSFFGYRAGYSSTGNYNSFLGSYVGNDNEASHNSFSGDQAGYYNTFGGYNSFSGFKSGYVNMLGEYNSFFGHQAGYHNTASQNSFFGDNAGYYNVVGSGNVFLGYKAGYNEAGSNRLYIANSETSSPLIYGEFDNSVVKINGTLVMVSDERLKKDIEPIGSAFDKVMQLEGVSYVWISANSRDRGFASERKIGLLAQNVEAVLPELVHTDAQGYKSVAYNKIVAVLIEAFKEQQIKRQQKEAYFDALLKQKEAGFEGSLKEEDARFEALLREKDALIEELTAKFEELSVRITAMENPAKTLASK